MPSEFLAEMNEDGYVVASIDYRLSMDAPFPAHIEDCKAAIRFLRAHAAEYKIDKENFSVIGESAGGHLSALAAMSRDDEFIDEVFPEESSAVKSAVVWYGPADMRSRGTAFGSSEIADYLYSNNIDQDDSYFKPCTNLNAIIYLIHLLADCLNRLKDKRAQDCINIINSLTTK
jgi:hypothetical protein